MKKQDKFNVKRRAALKKSLKGAIATGAVATSYGWSKPVVESVVLPVHARTSGCDISITNITVNESACADCGQVFSASNPTSGSSLGTFPVDGSADNGALSASGVIVPPPPAGTVVQISGTAQQTVDNTPNNCFFAQDGGPCVREVPVNSTNGDFSLSGEAVNGLDDNGSVNQYTIRFVTMDCPDFVVTFSTVSEN